METGPSSEIKFIEKEEREKIVYLAARRRMPALYREKVNLWRELGKIGVLL